MPSKRTKSGSRASGASRSRRGAGRSGGGSTPSLFAGLRIPTTSSSTTSTRGSGGLFARGGPSSWNSGTAGLASDQSYLRLSTRPLHVLVFLLPLILFYEAAAAFHVLGGSGAGDGGAAVVEETIRARRILADFFAVFDVGGIYLPGILVFVVLMLWHVLTRDPWRIRGRVIWMMFLEALIWTPPMLVLGQVLYKLLSGSMGASPPVTAGLELLAASAAGAGGVGTGAEGGADLAQRSLMARAAIAVGAGLYEEMLFRMVGIALFHLILVDLIGMGSKKGTILAVVLAALAFAFYHDVTGAASVGGADVSSHVRWADAGFFVFAGIYFGLVYVWRGFGVVVAVHTLYDLAVLVFLKPPPVV
ncbi:MAG: type II CAAX prenyl endopeptidase Rce1 family protein [Phycisphaerales bacterium]